MPSWFRFYNEVLDDPKVQRLPANQFRCWVNLMCLASRHNPRGELPCLDDIAFALRMTPESVQVLVEALTKAGLLDRDAGGTLRPHNWDNRQFASDSSAERVRLHRSTRGDQAVTATLDRLPWDGEEAVTVTEPAAACNGEEAVTVTAMKRPGNGAGNVPVTASVTPPDTDTDTDTETEHTGGGVGEEKRASHSGAPHSAADEPPVRALEIFTLWNEVCAGTLPAAAKLTDTRKRHIQARLLVRGRDAPWWRQYFARILASSFCRGETSRNGWRADIDWATRSEDVVTRVLEGRYDDDRCMAVAKATGPPERPALPAFLLTPLRGEKSMAAAKAEVKKLE